jgi:hypothetical protein
MSAYRRHSGGIWWQTSKGGDIDEIWKKHGANHLVLYSELLKIYGHNNYYRRIIDGHINGTVRILSKLDSSRNTNLIESYIHNFNDSCSNIFMSLCRTIGNTVEVQEKIQLQNNELNLKNSRLQLENDQLLNSLSWRITQPLRRLNKISKSIIKR